MYHYVYELTLKDQTKYIGVRSCQCDPEEDNYWGSASDPYVCKENCVKKEIIVLFTTREEAEEFEEHLHRVYEVDVSKEYRNQKIGVMGFSSAGKKLSPEHKEKVSKALRGRPITEKQRQVLKKGRLSCLGKKLSPEHKAKLLTFNLGKKRSKETKAKISKAKTGKPRSTNTSGHVGVHLDQAIGKWRAQIGFAGVRRHLGCYSSFSTAAKAYNTALEEIRKTGKLDYKTIRAKFKESK